MERQQKPDQLGPIGHDDNQCRFNINAEKPLGNFKQRNNMNWFMFLKDPVDCFMENEKLEAIKLVKSLIVVQPRDDVCL